MKTIFITIAFLIFITLPSFSQMRFDVVGGLTPQSSPATADLFVNRHDPHEEFRFNMNKVSPQYFIGAKGHVQLLSPFFVEAGLTYTRRKSTYEVNYTMIDKEHPVSYHTMNEIEHMVMLPANIGVNLGSVEIISGLRLMKTTSKRSNLDQLAGFTTDGNPVKVGWQAGAGFYLFSTRIGLEYHGNFSRVGSGMYVNNQSLELMNVPGQIVLTLQHSL